MIYFLHSCYKDGGNKPVILIVCMWFNENSVQYTPSSKKLNGNIFRVTGPSCGEFTGHRWIPRPKASDAELWCFPWSAPWINSWVNNHEAGDLRRHSTHYDITVTGVVPEAIVKGRDKWLHLTVSVRCNYLSMPLMPASGTTLLNYEWVCAKQVCIGCIGDGVVSLLCQSFIIMLMWQCMTTSWWIWTRFPHYLPMIWNAK